MTVLGVTRDGTNQDPLLGSKMNELVQTAAKRLVNARMIMADQVTGALIITDMGRIAAKYYIRCASIEIFDKEFKPNMSEADVLRMLSMSTEVRRFPFQYGSHSHWLPFCLTVCSNSSS